MGYVAVKGGQEAIENANELAEYFRLKGKTQPIDLNQLSSQMRFAVDRVMGEGSLYAPEHAALALLQTEGDTFEAAFHLRAYRATLQRRYVAETLNTREMTIQRRISSCFREIPGGQILGPSRDYSFRLLNPLLVQMALGPIDRFLNDLKAHLPLQNLHEVTSYPKVIDLFVKEGLMRTDSYPDEDRRLVDVTREAIKFPAPRSAVLQMLARAETGALLCMAYSTIRGFGNSHGVIGELRVGDTAVWIKDPRGRRRYIGKIKVTETEMVGSIRVNKKSEIPYLSVGYGLCFGQNETKSISMGMVESALRKPDPASPANNPEFVLYHTEIIESYGMLHHLKLPHYVTFQSTLQNIRNVKTMKSPEPELASVSANEDEDDND